MLKTTPALRATPPRRGIKSKPPWWWNKVKGEEEASLIALRRDKQVPLLGGVSRRDGVVSFDFDFNVPTA